MAVHFPLDINEWAFIIRLFVQEVFMSAATSRRKEESAVNEAPSARNVVLSVAVSLDGYIARPDGGVDWLREPCFMDPAIDFAELMRPFDVVLAGRKTLDVDKLKGGGGMGKATCYIFSRTKPSGKRKGAEYVNRPPGELVSELKSRPGKDIWVMGRGELAREFLREDLLDRMDLTFIPVLLGEGIPLFPAGFPQRAWTLASHRIYPSGIVSLSYARKRAERNS
jgi:dihydrofolate reductase